MKIKDLRRQTARLLHGHYAEGAAVLSVCIPAWFCALLIELLLCSLLYRIAVPYTLIQTVMPVLRYTICTLLMTPFLLGALWWLVQTANGEANPPGTVRMIYRSRRLMRRGGKLLVTLALIAALTVIPVICALYGGCTLMRRALTAQQDGVLLFAAAQMFALAVAAALWRYWLLLGIYPAAFLFMDAPLQRVGWLLSYSFRLMDGRRSQLLKILLFEIFRPRLFLVTRLGVTTAYFLKTAASEK